jgi:hypothetical protein
MVDGLCRNFTNPARKNRVISIHTQLDSLNNLFTFSGIRTAGGIRFYGRARSLMSRIRVGIAP